MADASPANGPRPSTIAMVADIAANLRAYIAEEAEKLATPMVVEARQQADERVRAAEFEVQRKTDLVDELRRQLTSAHRVGDQAREASAELKTIRFRWPGLWNENGTLRGRGECIVMQPVDETVDDGW